MSDRIAEAFTLPAEPPDRQWCKTNRRHFTTAGEHAFAGACWECRDQLAREYPELEPASR